MNKPTLKTITMHWDGNNFIVMHTVNSIIARHEKYTEDELDIPKRFKDYLKDTK